MCFYQPAVIFLPLKSALLPAGCHGGAFEKAFCCCVYTRRGRSKKQPATGTVMEEGCKSSLTDITGTATTRLPHGHTHMASQSSSPSTVLVGVRSHIRRTSHKDRCGEPAPSLLRAGWCWLTWAASEALAVGLLLPREAHAAPQVPHVPKMEASPPCATQAGLESRVGPSLMAICQSARWS